MNNNNGFFENVYCVVRKIPHGKVSTYGAIANFLGSGKSARAVGWAMNSSHKFKDIPAHRVVNRNGLLTGKHHFAGTNLMKDLLESEGIKIFENTVLDFENVVWDPSKDLD